MIKRISEAITKAESVDQLRKDVDQLTKNVNEMALALKHLAEVVRDHNHALRMAALEQEQILEILGKSEGDFDPVDVPVMRKGEKPN